MKTRQNECSILKEHLKWRYGQFRQFSKFRLSQQLFAFKEFCTNERLSNIFTTNVTKLTKAILKSSYRVLQESPYLIPCMIFKEKYFSDYILLTDKISLSGCIFFVRHWAICTLQLLTKLWSHKFWN